MDDCTVATNPWQEVYEAMVAHALRGLQVVYDEFNVALEEWLNDIVNHPIPEDWREEVARFVQQTERNGLEILPESIRAIEAIIESCIAGTDEFAPYGPAPCGPARSTPRAPIVETAAPAISKPPSKPQPLPPLVGYPDIPVGRRGPAVNAERLFDEKLASAKQHFAVLDQILKAAGEKIDAAKPGEDADVEYEADMVQKHLFLYNEDLAVARDLWLRFNLSGDANSRLDGMPSPVTLGLPAFATPAQAQRMGQQLAAIERRLRGDNASMDALVTGMAATDTAATAAGIVTGAGILIVAAKRTGRWAVVKIVVAGGAMYYANNWAEDRMHAAGASDQTIRGVQLAAAVITLILLRRLAKRAAPRKPAPEQPNPPAQAPPTEPSPTRTPAPDTPESPYTPRPVAPGNPELGKLIREVARMGLTGAEKVKLLEQGSGKIAGVVFKRVTGFPGVAGVFKGAVPSPGVPAQILVVLQDGRVLKGSETAIRLGPSGTLGIFIGELKEVL